MGRALRIIEAVCAAAFVAAALIAAAAVGTGALTVDKAKVALRALRGELVEPATASEKPEEPKDLASRYADEALKEKQRAVEALTQQESMLAVQVNERRAELNRLETEATRVRKGVSDRVDAVARAEKAFAETKAAHDALVSSTGFRKEVETFENMKPADAARQMYGFENAAAVELLRAFEPDTRARVITEIDRLDRAPENAKNAPKAAALLKLLWPGETANAGGAK